MKQIFFCSSVFLAASGWRRRAQNDMILTGGHDAGAASASSNNTPEEAVRMKAPRAKIDLRILQRNDKQEEGEESSKNDKKEYHEAVQQDGARIQTEGVCCSTTEAKATGKRNNQMSGAAQAKTSPKNQGRKGSKDRAQQGATPTGGVVPNIPPAAPVATGAVRSARPWNDAKSDLSFWSQPQVSSSDWNNYPQNNNVDSGFLADLKMKGIVNPDATSGYRPGMSYHEQSSAIREALGMKDSSAAGASPSSSSVNYQNRNYDINAGGTTTSLKAVNSRLPPGLPFVQRGGMSLPAGKQVYEARDVERGIHMKLQQEATAKVYEETYMKVYEENLKHYQEQVKAQGDYYTALVSNLGFQPTEAYEQHMEKYLDFNGKYLSQIISGEKRATTRLFFDQYDDLSNVRASMFIGNDRLPKLPVAGVEFYAVSKSHNVAFAKLRMTHVAGCYFGFLSDDLAKHEGFENAEAFKKELQIYYPDAKDNTPMAVFYFEIVEALNALPEHPNYKVDFPKLDHFLVEKRLRNTQIAQWVQQRSQETANLHALQQHNNHLGNQQAAPTNSIDHAGAVATASPSAGQHQHAAPQNNFYPQAVLAQQQQAAHGNFYGAGGMNNYHSSRGDVRIRTKEKNQSKSYSKNARKIS